MVVAPVRRALHDGAARWPWFRRIVQIGARELERALHDDLYTEGYYGEASAPAVALDIGTAEYTRTATHADGARTSCGGSCPCSARSTSAVPSDSSSKRSASWASTPQAST